jgi:hypothetical protein
MSMLKSTAGAEPLTPKNEQHPPLSRSHACGS